MEKNELIKKHRNIRIFSIFIMILSFSLYLDVFIYTLYNIYFSTQNEIFQITNYFLHNYFLFYFFFPNFYGIILYLPFLEGVNFGGLSFLIILIYILFPFIFMFALYKQIFTLTKKNFLAFMDENSLIFNLKTIKKNLFNLILVFFLFVSPFLLIIMILLYIYLIYIIKKI